MNPFAPSPLRAAIGEVFVKLEDMTGTGSRTGASTRILRTGPNSRLGNGCRKWLGAPVARHIEHQVEAQSMGLVPARRWDGAAGDHFQALRDRAGFVQRAFDGASA